MNTPSPKQSVPPPPVDGDAPDCPWIMARAAAFCRWELPEDQFEAVEEHLRDCPDCAKAVQARGQAEDQSAVDSSSPQDFTSQVMVRIRGWETAQMWERRRRLVLRAAACFVVFLLPIFACVAHRHLTSPPETVAAVNQQTIASVHVVSTQATGGNARSNETIDLGVAEELQQEFANTLAALEAKAVLPRTDAELEAWARREYPADMWLYDLLRERYDYSGKWDELLRESGEFLRFDYPTSMDGPNCRSTPEALERVAGAAGFELHIGMSGDIPIPVQYLTSPLIAARISPQRSRIPYGSGTPARSAPIIARHPSQYASRLTNSPELLRSALVYLHVSGNQAGNPLAAMTPKWRSLLLSSLTPPDPARNRLDCRSTSADQLQSLLEERERNTKQFLRAPRTSNSGLRHEDSSPAQRHRDDAATEHYPKQ